MSGYYFKPLKGKHEAVEEFYFYEVSEKIIIGKKDLAKLLGVTLTTIDKYEKKGLERSSLSAPRIPMYDLLLTIEWYKSNIDTKHRATEPKIKDTNVHPDLEFWLEDMEKWESVPIKHLPKDELERRISVKDYVMKDVKAKLITKEVIESDKVDFAKAEVTVTVLSHLRSLKKLLPMMVGNKDPHEVTPILDEHFKKSVESMYKFVNIEIPEESNFKFWDVVAVVIELLKNGASPKELIKRLNV